MRKRKLPRQGEGCRDRSIEQQASKQVDQSPSPPRTKDFASGQGLERIIINKAIISTTEKYIDKFLEYAEKHPESLTAALKAKEVNEEEFRRRLSRDKKWIEDYKAGKIIEEKEVDSSLSRVNGR